MRITWFHTYLYFGISCPGCTPSPLQILTEPVVCECGDRWLHSHTRSETSWPDCTNPLTPPATTGADDCCYEDTQGSSHQYSGTSAPDRLPGLSSVKVRMCGRDFRRRLADPTNQSDLKASDQRMPQPSTFLRDLCLFSGSTNS